MKIQKREYADGTFVTVRDDFRNIVGGRAMCSDGKVRRLLRISQHADTYFSIPGSVQVSVDGKRVTVAGFVTFQTRNGNSTETPNDPVLVKFYAYEYRKNWKALPPSA